MNCVKARRSALIFQHILLKPLVKIFSEIDVLGAKNRMLDIRAWYSSISKSMLPRTFVFILFLLFVWLCLSIALFVWVHLSICRWNVYFLLLYLYCKISVFGSSVFIINITLKWLFWQLSLRLWSWSKSILEINLIDIDLCFGDGEPIVAEFILLFLR